MNIIKQKYFLLLFILVKHDYEDDQFKFESYEQSLPEDHMDYQR